MLKLETTIFALTLMTLGALSLEVEAQTEGDATVDALIGLGFENVGWSEDEKERVYILQNTTYKLQAVGLRKAIDVVQDMGLPADKVCRIVVLDNNVPQVSLRYRPIVGDSVPPPEVSDWDVTYDLGPSWKTARRAKRNNSSLFKVDIVVYPQLLFKNVVITQIYQACLDVSPAIEVSLWKGSRLQVQVAIPVYNDGYSGERENIRWGYMNLQQDVRLPYNIFARATVGFFSQRTYGAEIRLFRPFSDERFSLEAKYGFVGVGYFNTLSAFKYSKETIHYWSVGPDFYWPYFNVQFQLRLEQYLMHDIGLRGELIRHFKYASVGFYAEISNKASSNGGFRIQIALPPYKYRRRGYIPRITTSTSTGITYNGGNEGTYYLMPHPSAGDNILTRNKFNPKYLKTEIEN